MKNIYLIDRCRSVLSSYEIKKFKTEITKIKCQSVCSTVDVVKLGIQMMNLDKFKLLETQLDI